MKFFWRTYSSHSTHLSISMRRSSEDGPGGQWIISRTWLCLMVWCVWGVDSVKGWNSSIINSWKLSFGSFMIFFFILSTFCCPPPCFQIAVRRKKGTDEMMKMHCNLYFEWKTREAAVQTERLLLTDASPPPSLEPISQIRWVSYVLKTPPSQSEIEPKL